MEYFPHLRKKKAAQMENFLKLCFQSISLRSYNSSFQQELLAGRVLHLLCSTHSSTKCIANMNRPEGVIESIYCAVLVSLAPEVNVFAQVRECVYHTYTIQFIRKLGLEPTHSKTRQISNEILFFF